ncbi:esterase-like activity of phytase family protein [Gloeothece verrucosa]|uniref:Endonuclease/exonuclease/phosphatase n=1 Tax=Gloeothece verrucosa (strain PCC 7822) TaxID=497965 RepID=E0UIK1_GLOV7|nr:esterase-like activity of phytase family protein [Gloeothece verrucosa]ADN12195.1 endonuclease/exonuclease/phosphatase [Gloeothece verrucosa PCC 7822]
MVIVTACSVSGRVMAEQRMFLDLSLEFLGQYQLPKQNYQETPVGGLSDLTYNNKINRFYVISDDRSLLAPARFYTFNLNISPTGIDKATIEGVTFLKNEQGQTYPKNSIDAEGIALSPRGTVFISSEGVISQGVAPFLEEYDLTNGQAKLNVPLPQRYLPNSSDGPPRGIQNNLGFEPLTISAPSVIADDPFRLFTATEAALIQDSPDHTTEENSHIRFLHYVINPFGKPLVVAEHIYPLDTPPDDALYYGLTALTALPKEGYFLSLERTLSLTGFGAKIFQVINTNANDTSSFETLHEITQINPLQKKLLLDLSELNIELDNLEGMSFGPHLPDGSPTLVLVSDNNFKDEQVTQFLLFKLVQSSR